MLLRHFKQQQLFKANHQKSNVPGRRVTEAFRAAYLKKNKKSNVNICSYEKFPTLGL